jgi:hypothetical protein
MSDKLDRIYGDAVAPITVKDRADTIRAATIDTEHNRGDALVQQRQSELPARRSEVGVRVHVPEAGSDHQSGHIQRIGRSYARSARIAHERDAIAGDRNIPGRPGIPGSIEHVSAEQEQVSAILGTERVAQRAGQAESESTHQAHRLLH